MTERELAQILQWHVRRYPLMQPIDALKLLYQGEFGGGHLIADPDACLTGLREEYAHTEQEEGSPLLEPLCGDVVRVNLAALAAAGIPVKQVFEAFLTSAQVIQGSQQRLAEKIDLLRRLASGTLLPFSLAALDDKLFSYAAQGFPPCSHSEEYRVAYRPAYRVLLRSLLKI